MIWQLILLEAKKMIRLWWVMPATLSLVVLYIWSFENRSISVKLNHTVADSSPVSYTHLDVYKRQKEILSTYLSKAGLQKEAHSTRLSAYSKGMRQKVGIAIALAKNADVILMDEPTSGLDPKATAEFTTICKELAVEGKTIFMATHDIFNAVNVGTRIGIMKQGELVHTIHTNEITANELQKLYLETI